MAFLPHSLCNADLVLIFYVSFAKRQKIQLLYSYSFSSPSSQDISSKTSSPCKSETAMMTNSNNMQMYLPILVQCHISIPPENVRKPLCDCRDQHRKLDFLYQLILYISNQRLIQYRYKTTIHKYFVFFFSNKRTNTCQSLQ